MSSLNQVVERVNEKRKLGSHQTLFSIDYKTGEIVKSWFSKLGKNIRNYIVSNATIARNSAKGETGTVLISDFANDRELGIIVRYSVQCPAGNEEKLVCSLYKEDTPEQALINIIENSVLNYTNSREAEFIDDFASEKDKLKSSIKEHVESETGLKTQFKIYLKYEDKLDTFKIRDKSIPIQLSKEVEEHSIIFNLDSEPDRDISRIVYAVIAYPNLHLLKNKIIRFIQAFFKSEVSFQSFYDGFRDIEPNEKFEKELNELLYNEGRLHGKWKIEPRIKGGKAKEFEPKSINIPCTPHEARESILIKNELQMILEDAGKLKSSGVSDLDQWIEENLKRIIEEEVFGMKYLDFLLRFGPKEEKIRERMKLNSELIGYKVKHLISSPDMKEEVYLKPALYEFNNYKSFPTKENGLDVNLAVSATFFIPDLNKVENWLNKNTNLKSVIEESIKSVLEQNLHRETPETVYMRFPLLEPQLSKAVKVHLENEYHAEVLGDIVIKTMPTPIGSFVQEIIDATRDFIVKIPPLGERTQEVTFHGKFTITSIDENGWSRIKKMDFTVDEVKDFYVDSLKTTLGTLPGDEYLIYANPELQQNLEKLANERVDKAVTERYGVNIAINNFYRDPIKYESLRAEMIEKQKINELKKVEHLLAQEDDKREHVSIIEDKKRRAQIEQFGILNRKEAEALESIEDLEALDNMDEIEKQKEKRVKSSNANLEQIDEILSKNAFDSKKTERLQQPDPMLALSGGIQKSEKEQSKNDNNTNITDNGES
jgi:hypothetical protein